MGYDPRTLICFTDYSSPAISTALDHEIREALLTQFGSAILLKLLVRFLEVHDLKLVKCRRRTAASRHALGLFYVSLHCPNHLDIRPKRRYALARHLKHIAKHVWGFSLDDLRTSARGELVSGHCALLPHLHALAVNAERQKFWQGWVVENSHGKRVFPQLHVPYRVLGVNWCNGFHKALSEFLLAGRADGLRFVNMLCSYVEATKSAERDFTDPDRLAETMNRFMVFYFQKGSADGIQVLVLKRTWKEFVRFAENHLLGKLWATVSCALPSPPAQKSSGFKTHLRLTGGVISQQKLLTAIPLHASDSEVKNLIYGKIREDLEAIKTWANQRLDKLRAGRGAFRNAEATLLKSPRVTSSIPARTSDHHEQILHLASKIVARYRPETYVKWNLDPSIDQLGLLGLPTNADIFAISIILVTEHPSITPAWISSLSMEKLSDAPVALHVVGHSSYLVGDKLRRGQTESEQRVLLSARARDAVSLLIEVTDPLRKLLHQQGSADRHKLFLYLTSLRGPVSTFNAAKQSHYLTDVLYQGLKSNSKGSSEGLRMLAENTTISRIRSSAAILVYFETNSVYKMADALGHKSYHPRLLDRYLPTPVRIFFQDRWIRNFQLSLVCEIVKDSEHRLRATGFKTLEQLDSFLESTTFSIPDDEGPQQANRTKERAVVNVSEEMLALLFSIETVELRQSSPSCGISKYWADFSSRLREALKERPDLQPLIATAEAKIDTELVEDLIYAQI